VDWKKWAGSRRNWSSLFESAMQPCLTCTVEFDGEDGFMIYEYEVFHSYCARCDEFFHSELV
jgi:hypothetical protein